MLHACDSVVNCCPLFSQLKLTHTHTHTDDVNSNRDGTSLCQSYDGGGKKCVCVVNATPLIGAE